MNKLLDRPIRSFAVFFFFVCMGLAMYHGQWDKAIFYFLFMKWTAED